MDFDPRWIALLCGIFAWLETIPGKVINKPGSIADNASKPLHEFWLSTLGFHVPRSITSASQTVLNRFASEVPSVCKTVGGQRADSRIVTANDFHNFIPEMGPVHLQEYIAGIDVRCHVLGDKVFAEGISSNSVDYRTDTAKNQYAPIECPAYICKRMAQVTRECGLAFAGWDFKVPLGGNWYCLEMNPMPGYSGYDARCGEAITGALVSQLEGGD